MFIYNVSVFPKEHHAKLKELVADIAHASKHHTEAYDLLLAYHVRTPELSKVIDDQSFKVVELYRNIIDSINAYGNYLVMNDLIKYISNAKT
jgi:hypothetical protein